MEDFYRTINSKADLPKDDGLAVVVMREPTGINTEFLMSRKFVRDWYENRIVPGAVIAWAPVPEYEEENES